MLDSYWKTNYILWNFLINIMAHQYHTNNLNVNLTDFSNDGSMEEYLNGITMDNPNFDKDVLIILWEVYMNRFDQFFVKNLNFSEEFMKFSLRSLLIPT